MIHSGFKENNILCPFLYIQEKKYVFLYFHGYHSKIFWVSLCILFMVIIMCIYYYLCVFMCIYSNGSLSMLIINKCIN